MREGNLGAFDSESLFGSLFSSHKSWAMKNAMAKEIKISFWLIPVQTTSSPMKFLVQTCLRLAGGMKEDG